MINLEKIKKILIFFLILLFLASFIFLFQFHFNKEKNFNEKKPNVILISIDSLGANHLSFYGYSRNTTPNLDSLSKEGILFKNYIAQAYLTPISEMAVHTGMHPSSSTFVSFETLLPENTLTLSQILKLYGYRTAAFGNSPEFIYFPIILSSFNRSFDVYDFLNIPYTQLIQSPDSYRSSEIDQERIFEFIKKEDKEPFFIWIAIGSAHFPYGKSPENFREENYSGILNNKNLDWHNGIFPWIYENKLYSINERGEKSIEELKEEDLQYIIDCYDDDVLNMDKWIGDFLFNLKKEGLDEKTIIIVQSEHGEEFGEKGYISHYDIFDSTIKTFLIIKTPGIYQKGLEIEQQIQGIDILPTILDILKIPLSHKIEGTSLISLIENPKRNNITYVIIERTPLWERVMFQGYSFDKQNKSVSSIENYAYSTAEKQARFYDRETIQYIQSKDFLNENDFAIRTNEWKLIYRKSKIFQENYSWWKVLKGEFIDVEEFELYNLKMDPKEQENVINDHPLIAEELKNKLNETLQKFSQEKKTINLERTFQEYF